MGCLSEIGSIECESTSSDHQVLEDNIIYYPLKNSSKIGKISEIIEAKVAYYNWHMHVCNFNWSYEIFVILLLKILFDTLVGQNVYSLKPS